MRIDNKTQTQTTHIQHRQQLTRDKHQMNMYMYICRNAQAQTKQIKRQQHQNTNKANTNKTSNAPTTITKQTQSTHMCTYIARAHIQSSNTKHKRRNRQNKHSKTNTCMHDAKNKSKSTPSKAQTNNESSTHTYHIYV